ncbi:MAG: hydrogenase nickel incorporation protein HypB [Planctomycetaceae bacterium]|nr:hydrogenase nickel incorporation protein HypB [Planctomycetaceae bacterium]
MERTIDVKVDLKEQRRRAADGFRKSMSEHGTYVVRLLSSPGAGKTTLLQKTAENLGRDFRVGILVGDVETERDAERLAPFAPSHQITTGGACHLELPLIERALPELGAGPFDFLFVEDIGNLICPASHDLGEHLRVVLLSATEGDDKPGKYPKAFRSSDVVVISKTDLLPYVPFSVEKAQQDAKLVQSQLRFFSVSAMNDDGIAEWCDFLREQRKAQEAFAESSEAVGR